MKLFVQEKPTLSTPLNSNILTEKDLIICNNSFYYSFDFSNFELFSTPHYRLSDSQYTAHFFKKEKDSLIKKERYSAGLDVTNIDEILFYMFIDHSGVRAMDLTLSSFKNINDIEINVLDEKYPSSNDDLEKRYTERKSFFNNKEIEKHRKIYQSKDYLDYNFNGLIKSLFENYSFLTRNMIWTLLLIKDGQLKNSFKNKKSTNDDVILRIIDLLHKNNIGSAASQTLIAKTLLDSELVFHDSITEDSQVILNRLKLNEDNLEDFFEINAVIESDDELKKSKMKIDDFIQMLNLKSSDI